MKYKYRLSFINLVSMKEEGSGGGGGGSGCGGRGGGRGFGGLIPFFWPWAPFLESPDYFSGPKNKPVLCFSCLHSKSKFQ